MFKITYEETERRFLRAEFIDFYGMECSIQESSLATEPAIWLGIEPNRMHLTPEMAKALATELMKFAETGSLA